MFNHILRRNRHPEGQAAAAPAQRAPQTAQPDARRRNSQETLATLVNSVHSNPTDPEGGTSVDSGHDGQSVASEETVLNQPRVFGRPVHEFTTVREFAIMNTFLQSGVEVYESQQAFDGGEPALWQTSTSVMSVFKRGAPFMVIRGGPAREGLSSDSQAPAGGGVAAGDVTVHHKVVSAHVSAYVLQFPAPMPPLVLMNNNSSRPSADFEYNHTKLRVTGVTGTTSTFGNGLLKVFVMKPDTAMLSDGVELRPKNKLAIENQMFRLVESQDRGHIQHAMRAHEAQVHHPIATFREEETKVSGRIVKSGTMRVFGRDHLGPDEFVLVCVLLVLREQEGRKNRGYGRPREMEVAQDK